MDEKFLKKVKNKALRVFKNKEDAEDFLPWYIIKRLEGKSKHQLIDHAIIDYKRENFGHLHTLEQKNQAKEDFYLKDTDQQNQELAHMRDLARKILTNKDYTIFYLYSQEELTMLEIGLLFGVSESRICQKIKTISKKLANIFIKQDMNERLETENMELNVEWIEL